MKRLGDNFINNWFADPAGFMNELVSSGYIIPGDVEASPFFQLLRPTGPMFRVFTDDEIRIWEDWTRALADPNTPSEPETDVAVLMARMVQTLGSRQQATSGHKANLLTGETSEGRVTQPVAWWFDQPVPAFLAALADPANGWITPGDPASSRFITELASGDHPMARVLGEVAPGTAHKTWRSIAIDWIAAGCPLPSSPGADAPPAAMLAPVSLATGPATHVDTDAPKTSVTAAVRQEALAVKQIPLLGLFQNETWQPEYAGIPIYGNGALH
jgi:hypothetical protein